MGSHHPVEGFETERTGSQQAVVLGCHTDMEKPVVPMWSLDIRPQKIYEAARHQDYPAW